MRSLDIVLLCLLGTAHLTNSLQWLAVGMTSTRLDRQRPHSYCKSLKGLTRKQIRFCKKHLHLMDSVRYGAATSYSECQFQFNKRRWNCTVIDPVTLEVVGDVLLREGTRESAFVHAVSAAGIAYKVTRDCARGLNGDQCGCDNTRSQGYDLMGCSDHVQYGIAVSQEFVDAVERPKNGSRQALVNLHNNQAGRQVLRDSMRKDCKCHGMSGSCEVKTCWHALPSFREIGTTIKDKFDGASEVAVVEEEHKQRIVMKHQHFKRHTKADLVYLAQSPDFCEQDTAKGVFGTKGRECNISSQGVDGCQLLCCNRGSEKRVTMVDDKCDCKFHYCCRVECTPCKRREERHYCL